MQAQKKALDSAEESVPGGQETPLVRKSPKSFQEGPRNPLPRLIEYLKMCRSTKELKQIQADNSGVNPFI